MVATVTNVSVRRQVSGAIETPIDGYIDDASNKILYEKWDDRRLGESIKYRGGEVGITAELILGAPEDALRDIYGDEFAVVLLDISRGVASSY